MTIKYVTDDLVQMAQDGKFDVIAHGCNCGHCMSAGIALSIAKTWPEALAVDKLTPHFDPGKMGKISVANVKNNAGGDLAIVNAYTQFDWKGKGGYPLVDYKSVKTCLRIMKHKFTGQRIGLPLIGAGLAGGDWEIIELIIEKELQGEDVTVVKWIGDVS